MAEEGLDELGFPGEGPSPDELAGAWSDRETGKPAENLVSNEDSATGAVAELKRRVEPGGVYLGVGPEQNLSLIAGSKPVLAVIADFRRRNGLVHFVHKTAMARSRDRRGYLKILTARKPEARADRDDPAGLVDAFEEARFDRKRLDREVAEARRYLGPLGWVGEEEWGEVATIQAKLAGPGMRAKFLGLPGYPSVGDLIRKAEPGGYRPHFLANEGTYRAVRELQCEDRILPIVADFGREGGLGRVAGWMRGRGLGLSVVYVSDVEFFLLRAGAWAGYLANLRAFPRRDGAVIVRTSTRPIDHPERRAGDQCTTVVRDLGRFLDEARADRPPTAEGLFL